MTAETAEQDTVGAAAASPVEDRPKDLEVIIPEAGKVTINGVDCGVRRLRMLEFFKLMSIVTNGLGPAAGNIDWTGARDSEEFNGLMMAAFLMAVPNQAPQFVAFIQEIVEPEADAQKARLVKEYLANPEIEDLFPIVDAIIENEKDNFYELMGKARAYLARWQKAFQRGGSPADPAR